MIQKADVAVVGAGIAGIAHAWEAARQGLSVVLFERDAQARSASIRNFGMILPIGASPGIAHERAMRSLQIWRKLALETGVWHRTDGVLIVAYHADESEVMHELAASSTGRDYGCTWLTRDLVLQKSPVVKDEGLIGGLWNTTGMLVDPREVVSRLPLWLRDQFSVILRFGTPVKAVSFPVVETEKETWRVERVIVCPGSDLVTLFPSALAELPLVYCKLQMMRTVAQPSSWHLGPIVISGLSLRHYPVFATCSGVSVLSQRITRDHPELDLWGIHVMVAQNGKGELMIGDSHEYGPDPEPFDHAVIDTLILRQLEAFLNPPSLTIQHRWHGIYVKHDSQDAVVVAPETGVRIVTGLGGMGMTSSFALAHDVFESW